MYKAKVSTSGNPSPYPSAIAWNPPLQHTYKINFDAHVMEGMGVSFRFAILNNEGKMVVVAVNRHDAVWSSEMAEAGAARYGLEVAQRLGFTKVVLESDAANIVKEYTKKRREQHPIFFFIFEDISCLSSSFELFSCSHVRRAGNTVAHTIARWDTGSNSERICMNSFP